MAAEEGPCSRGCARRPAHRAGTHRRRPAAGGWNGSIVAARRAGAWLAALALLAGLPAAALAGPGTYQVGTIPIAGGVGALELPVGRGLAAELDLALLGQGTFDDRNPFAYLSLVMPGAWLHYDRVENLRLSLSFQEALYREVPALGLESSHEERAVLRARLQQPRGEAALYEMAQLDVRSFDDPGGTHRVVFRPRFRLGQGFNLDAVHIHSLTLYEEVAFRFAAEGYTTRAFDFFRAFAGYTWTTRRGTFLTLGVVGQVSLNPPATRYDVVWGPVIGIKYRFRSAPPATAPEPPEAEVP